MDYGFRHFITEKLFTKHETYRVGVVAGTAESVAVGLTEDII